MRNSMTRRAALATLLSVAASPVAAAVPARKFRAIEVDVSALRAYGDTITAQWLAEALPGLLNTAFAGDLAPGDRSAPALVARIDSVSYGTPGSSMQGLTSTNDFIEGAGVVKSGGRTQETFPLTTSVGVDAYLIDAANGGKLRAEALAGVFARWLPSQIGH